ncbi:MAG: DMT family transporter [Pseudomonadota bacterium]
MDGGADSPAKTGSSQAGPTQAGPTQAGSGVLAARPVLGAGAMLGNTLLIPLMAVAIRYLEALEIGTLEMLSWRTFLVLGVLLPIAALPRFRREVMAADRRAHLVHAAFTISAMSCFYVAIQHLSIATATAINFTTPIFALLLAAVFFGERVTRASWVAVAVGFLGALLILRPSAEGVSFGAGIALVGALLGSGMALAVRRMPARSSNFAVIFHLSLFGGLLFAPLYAAEARIPPLPAWPWLAMLAAVALGVHSLLALAYRLSSSMVVGGLDYARLIWALALGYLLFAEIPDLWDAAGIALIVASGLFILYREMKPRRAPQADMSVS